MKITKYLAATLPALIVAAGCKQHNKDAAADVPQRTVFLDRSTMDTTVKPGDNFFMYANGLWVKKTQIPASESGWGSFYTLFDDNTKNLRHILDEVSSKENKNGSLEQKVGDFYESGMDTAAMDKMGYGPIKPHWKR